MPTDEELSMFGVLPPKKEPVQNPVRLPGWRPAYPGEEPPF